jgi:hypothetical protein
MAEDLVFPRLIYRGAPDTLGAGPHAHPTTDALVGETARCENQSDLDTKLKEGWRLTREIDEPAAKAAPVPPAGKDKK